MIERICQWLERGVMIGTAIVNPAAAPASSISAEVLGQLASPQVVVIPGSMPSQRLSTISSNLDIRLFLIGSFPNRPENLLDELPLENAKVNLGDQVTPGVRIYVVNKKESYPAELIVETKVQTQGVEAKACTLPPSIDCTLKAPLDVSVSLRTVALGLPGVGLIEENSLTRIEAIRGFGREHIIIRVKDKANENVLFEQQVDVTVLPEQTQFLPLLQVSR
ncbi:hypothetical protein HYU45_04670 [Candidatus Daviesbacteria bacterium]|nr:hypothetical protein [Candidatus Daviesbacteria bacterium]